MQNIINPDKRDFEPSLYILHINTNGLSLKDTPEEIYINKQLHLQKN